MLLKKLSTYTFIAVVILGGVLTESMAANRANGKSELPANAQKANYFWRGYYTEGFGFYSPTYQYVIHPGYSGIESSPGYLGKHPAEIYTIFSESEAHAISQDWRLLELTRTSPLDMNVDGDFRVRWDALRIIYDNPVAKVDWGKWNFIFYPKRVCKTNEVLWLLYENNVPVEFYCSLTLDGVKDEKNNGPICPLNETNPINGGTGNKYEHVNVYRGVGRSSLKYDLHYNSHSEKERWLSSYSGSISGFFENIFSNYDEIRNIDHAKNLIVSVRRPDGRVYSFQNTMDWDLRTTELLEWQGDADVVYRLYSKNDEVTGELIGFIVELPNGDREFYGRNGALQEIQSLGGVTQTLEYDASDKLTSVTDSFGNALNFSYIQNQLLMQIPDGSEYRFVYSGSDLSEIVFPDSTPLDLTDNPRKKYLYEDARFPGFLTGITDENGSRSATWAYDDQGRGVSSEHANNVDNAAVVYNADGSATITNSLGKSTTYHYTTINGVKKVTQVEGHPTAMCDGSSKTYSYDSKGYLTSKSDWNGNVTSYLRNDRGLEVSRTEALGTSEERIITTEWHETLPLKLLVTEPGKVTEFTYDSQGSLISRTERISQ